MIRSLALMLALPLVLGVFPGVLLSNAEAQVILPGGDDEKTERKKPRKKRCPSGQVRNEDTQGECCWPGQVYSGDRCIGIPTSCPEGYEADATEQACILPDCVGGKVRTQEVYCCWPGQAYSKSRGECVGVPECPLDLTVQGEMCIGDIDGDGLLANDSCPEKPEDMDGFQDDDGCPDNDNDADGVADKKDACPLEAEDVDDFEDADGCPDTDNDGDGIADADDACPMTVGAAEDKGCPVEGEEVVIKKSEEPGTTSDGGIGPMGIGGWVAIGTGVLLAGGGGAMMAVAAGKRGEVEDALDTDDDVVTSMTRAEALALQDDANTFDTLGVVGIGVGVAAIGAGVVLLLLDDGGESDTTVTGIVGPDGEGMILIGGQF